MFSNRSASSRVGLSSLGFLLMSKSPEKAPAGQWSMPNDKLLKALGQFVLAWSSIEATIEVGIGKQLGTPPLESSIVTAGLMFKARAGILRNLLHRDPKNNAEAIEILKEIVAIEDRNDIMHSIIGGHADLLFFNRRHTNRATFSSKIVRYSQIRMNTVVLQIADLSARLTKALGLSKEDYEGFFQEAHNAVNSPEGSG